MSYHNPTGIKVGMTGTFAGITYRVLGRVVMGVTNNGIIYHWNEFNLQADSGESTTLVYEVTADGFLRHMVRAIVGTLVEIGRGWRPAESMAQLITGGTRAEAVSAATRTDGTSEAGFASALSVLI